MRLRSVATVSYIHKSTARGGSNLNLPGKSAAKDPLGRCGAQVWAFVHQLLTALGSNCSRPPAQPPARTVARPHSCPPARLHTPGRG